MAINITDENQHINLLKKQTTTFFREEKTKIGRSNDVVLCTTSLTTADTSPFEGKVKCKIVELNMMLRKKRSLQTVGFWGRNKIPYKPEKSSRIEREKGTSY